MGYPAKVRTKVYKLHVSDFLFAYFYSVDLYPNAY